MNICVLSRADVKKTLTMHEVIDKVTDVYKLKSNGETVVWPLVSHDFVAEHGVMDIRSGYVKGRQLHGLKMLNSFHDNAKQGLPNFNGMLMLFDSNTGIPLGVMDAAHITCMRTGAAGAIGAKMLARADARNLLLVGAGNQAIFQIAAAISLMPQLKKFRIADPHNQNNAEKLASTIAGRLKDEFGIGVPSDVEFSAVDNLPEATADSDVVITITPSRTPLIDKAWVRPGTHFSCIGADMEGKEEIDPELFRGARIFADDTAQCCKVGEMELPLKQGVIQASDIAGEIGDLLAGKVRGRTRDDETTIFDATGLALLDLVVAKLAVDKAAQGRIGTTIDL